MLRRMRCSPAVDLARELVDHASWERRRDGEAAGHVSVERAVTDGELRLVARRQRRRCPNLLESAMRIVPRMRAWRFSSVDVRSSAAANTGPSVSPVGVEHFAVLETSIADAETFRASPRRRSRCPAMNTRPGHGDADHLVGSQRLRGERCGDWRIDSPGEADNARRSGSRTCRRSRTTPVRAPAESSLRRSRGSSTPGRPDISTARSPPERLSAADTGPVSRFIEPPSKMSLSLPPPDCIRRPGPHRGARSCHDAHL